MIFGFYTVLYGSNYFRLPKNTRESDTKSVVGHSCGHTQISKIRTRIYCITSVQRTHFDRSFSLAFLNILPYRFPIYNGDRSSVSFFSTKFFNFIITRSLRYFSWYTMIIRNLICATYNFFDTFCVLNCASFFFLRTCLLYDNINNIIRERTCGIVKHSFAAVS